MPNDVINLSAFGGPTREQLMARVEELEECLQEFVPFATCVRVDMQAHFSAATEDEAHFKGWNFKRDTLYIDQRAFRKAAKLMKKKL